MGEAALLQEAGAALMEAGLPLEACGFFQKALRLEPACAQAEKRFDRAKNLLVERWHYRMLNDRRRNLAYRTAIADRTQPGDVVLDIGCGSGILSFYAAEAGVSKIIACELNTVMYNIALQTIKQNNIDNIVLVNESSQNLDIEQYGGKASVVVAEIFDAGLFGEGALQTLSDTWKRLLISRPNGKVIPAKASLHVCGVQSKLLARKHRLIRTNENLLFTQINFENVNVHKEREPYDSEDLSFFEDIEYITEAGNILTVDFENVNEIDDLLSSSPISKLVTLSALKAGEIDAYAMWFDLILSESVTLTGDPRSPDKCSTWDPAIFHIRASRPVESGERVLLEMQMIDGMMTMVDKTQMSTDDVCVSEEILGILNDAEYVNSAIGAVGASCIHLVQLYPFESIKVLDYNPFPTVGFLMLTRGVERIVCSTDSKPLVSKLAELNNIDLRKISFFDGVTVDGVESFEMIVNYFVEPQGELRHVDINFRILKILPLIEPRGIMMPHKLKMVARLVSSEHLIVCNRVNDRNLSEDENTVASCKFRVADYVNMYQVAQNSFTPSDAFPKKYLSEEVVVYEQCLEPRLWKTIPVIPSADGFVNAIQSYYRIQLIPHGEELSMDRADSHINNIYHLIDPPISVKKGDKVDILVFSENEDAVKMILDDNN